MSIKLIGTDIDGVWTDAKMYYNDKGECMKSFSTYDGMAVQILRDIDIPVAILTSEKTNIVKERAKKLKIKNVYVGEKEKLKRMKYLCKKMKISMNEVAYIGDDINDMGIINLVKFSACPKDAVDEIKKKVSLILDTCGGDGCVREFSDLYLRKNKNI